MLGGYMEELKIHRYCIIGLFVLLLLQNVGQISSLRKDWYDQEIKLYNQELKLTEEEILDIMMQRIYEHRLQIRNVLIKDNGDKNGL